MDTEETTRTADELTLEEAFERLRLSGPYICLTDEEREAADAAARRR